jgi:DNA-directed RNA polymerase subunit RPC12/RpoP
MISFIILVCSRCGGYLIAKNEQKTKTCPYCGFKLAVEKAKKMAVAETAHEASLILRRLKTKSAKKKSERLSYD